MFINSTGQWGSWRSPQSRLFPLLDQAAYGEGGRASSGHAELRIWGGAAERPVCSYSRLASGILTVMWYGPCFPSNSEQSTWYMLELSLVPRVLCLEHTRTSS